MNRPPEILINSGFVTDKNGVFTEMVIPAVVNTLNAPQKITFMGETLNYIPSNSSTLQELSCPNMTANNVSFQNWTKLTSIYFGSLSQCNGETFKGCTSLTTVNIPKFSSNNFYYFNGCTGLRTVNLGSEGHPVVSMNGNTFQYVTTADLVITLYTTNGASLAGEPWGATNADVIYEEA